MREGCGGGDKAAEASPRGCEPACEWEEATAAGLRCEEERATADSKSGKGGERERERGSGAGRARLGASWRREAENVCGAAEGRSPRALGEGRQCEPPAAGRRCRQLDLLGT